MATAAADAPDLAVRSLVGRKLGRYEVLSHLASGGMASVYAARAHGVAGFERLVAVKVLHANLAHEDQFVSMLLDEARLAARIRHLNVVPTLDISDAADTGYFLVMEYIEGDHLAGLLQAAVKRNERLPVPVVLRVILDALSGLGAAHNLTDEKGNRLNLVHRDISPHNIIVGLDGVARLTDFGLAKAEVRLSHTLDGQVKGKLAYMAPEQASSGQTDARSDLFSAGIILWESLAGRRLFRAETNAAVMSKLLFEDISPPSAVYKDLKPFDQIALKALERDPSRRFQQASEFIAAIEQVASKTDGGVAHRNEVAKIVEKYAAEKLDRDRKRINGAIHAIGQTPHDMRPEPPSESASPSPSMLLAMEAVRGARWSIKLLTWFTGICLLLAVSAIGVLLYLRRQDDQLRVSEVTAVTAEPQPIQVLAPESINSTASRRKSRAAGRVPAANNEPEPYAENASPGGTIERFADLYGFAPPQAEELAASDYPYEHSSVSGELSAASAPSQEPAEEKVPIETRTRLDLARAYLAEGDNQRAIRILEQSAKSSEELGLLIETYRSVGDNQRAFELMNTYVEKYPATSRAMSYRRILRNRSTAGALRTGPAPTGGAAADQFPRKTSEALSTSKSAPPEIPDNPF